MVSRAHSKVRCLHLDFVDLTNFLQSRSFGSLVVLGSLFSPGSLSDDHLQPRLPHRSFLRDLPLSPAEANHPDGDHLPRLPPQVVELLVLDVVVLLLVVGMELLDEVFAVSQELTL